MRDAMKLPKAADLLFALVHKNYSLPLPPPPSPLPSPQEKNLKIAKKLYMSILSFVIINHWVPEGSCSQKSGVF